MSDLPPSWFAVALLFAVIAVGSLILAAVYMLCYSIAWALLLFTCG